MTPPEPRENTELVGHDGPAGVLAAAAGSGRLHHAWLLAGPEGVGKATLAFRFARWLLAGQPTAPAGAAPLYVGGEHPVFRRVVAEAHADLRVLEPNTGDKGGKEVLRIDDVRRAMRFLSLTPGEGGWRVVVVDQLERADRSEVQNALLKTLEEPPARTVLLVTSALPDRLLPTVRSRCRRLDLSPLTEAAMAPLLERWLPELAPDGRAALGRLADGSPGRALALAAGDGLAVQRLVEGVLGALPRPDPRGAFRVADALLARRDPAALWLFFALLRRGLAAALSAAGRGGAMGFLAGRSLAGWAVVWDKLGRLADETERLNLDRKQAVLTGLSWLAVR